MIQTQDTVEVCKFKGGFSKCFYYLENISHYFVADFKKEPV